MRLPNPLLPLSRLGRLTLASLLLAAAAAGALTGQLRDADASDHVPPPRADTAIAIGGRASGAPVPDGFVGLSIEYFGIWGYTGGDPAHVNPVLVGLVKGLAPGGSPSIRVGGRSADWSWWPAAGVRKPAGADYPLSDAWLRSAQALADATGARYLMDLNLQAADPAVAAAEANAFAAALGSHLAGLEIGNEPNWYARFAWYRDPAGHRVFSRAKAYDMRAFTRQFAQIGAALPRLPGVTLAGPTLGSLPWMSGLGHFMRSVPGLGTVTVHRYPLNRCFTTPGAPEWPSIANVLAARTSRGLAATIAPYAPAVHARGLRLRVDELDSVACGGQRGVSNTFAAALWTLDTLFAMRQAGADGVNFHTFPRAAYAPFHFNRSHGAWYGEVTPEYYGMLFFNEAAPVGSRLVPSPAAGPGARGVRSWATRGPDGRWRVVLINADPRRRHTAAVTLPVSGGPAVLTRLLAPSARARTGVTIDGRSFGPRTFTGRLTGRRRTVRVWPYARRYTVVLPPASAALLTVG